MNAATRQLTVVRAAEIAAPDQATPAWLIEHLCGSGAVAVIGGAPKCGKSWLALELAVAVASGRPCLGRFAVPTAGPVLLYAAQDTPLQVRQRIEQLCQARGAAFDTLELGLILEPSLRIDRAQDVERLRATLALRPQRLLILDPYVRLQSADENHATEVAAIPATLRQLSRTFSLALLLVHHARKSPGDSAGLALRGSSDFHAWGDSNLYLRRRGHELILTIEHRAAAAPPPLILTLAENPLRLEIRDPDSRQPVGTPLEQRLLAALDQGPCRLEQLRAAVGARKQTVVETLRTLEATGRVVRQADDWRAALRLNSVPGPNPHIGGNREPLRSSALPSDLPKPDPRQLNLIEQPPSASQNQ
ncbi:MAG: AAA family ATPase [Gemmatimonadetes bacterium]|nr:AAA family ATPase [Gemmatimonadota bacterium]